MPWSFALPQPIFASPILAVATPITTGIGVALLTNREWWTIKHPLLPTDSILQGEKPRRRTASSANRPSTPLVGSFRPSGPFCTD